jgi:pyruvate-formate lyase-activating enzyme
MFNWKVVPMCDKQKLDIDPKDLLFNGDFRKCNTYKSGGGYDKFPAICEERTGKKFFNQFVVQLYGCTLNCPYCYVTKDGIWSNYKLYSSQNLINKFLESKQDIFHLMGGSPGIYIENWHEIIDLLPEEYIFHSDLLLVEKPYESKWLKSINKKNCLYAVSIKGTNENEFYKNTNTKLNGKLFWNNFDLIVKENINFYLTYTGINNNNIKLFNILLQKRYGIDVLKNSFSIEIINYNAIQ